MSKVYTKTSSKERLKISNRTRELFKERDKSLDSDADAPTLPPQMWENAIIGKYYRPVKTQISFRVDNDVLDWLKSKGGGHLTRINTILRERMKSERRSKFGK